MVKTQDADAVKMDEFMSVWFNHPSNEEKNSRRVGWVEMSVRGEECQQD